MWTPDSESLDFPWVAGLREELTEDAAESLQENAQQSQNANGKFDGRHNWD